jgi:hypothetical protein
MKFICAALALIITLTVLIAGQSISPGNASRFEISYPDSLHNGPITGRMVLKVGDVTLGVDVDALKPGEVATIDGMTLGYPINLSELPAGDYDVQALLQVYTQVHRKDGRVLWLPMEYAPIPEWVPGNLLSNTQRVHIDPKASTTQKISLSKKAPARRVPPDNTFIRHVKIQSQLLSEFWGYPMSIGATVTLPKGFDTEFTRSYPAIYGFSKYGNIDTNAPPTPEAERQDRISRGVPETESDFAKEWTSENFPRVVGVAFEDQTPFFRASYGVNSPNNGPYADALRLELIPYLEKQFRLIPNASSRFLTGGSTYGWEALSLQIQYPTFFNGVWSLCPDPVDFRRYQMMDIYKDENAFEVAVGSFKKLVRPQSREADGQVAQTMREEARREAVLGSHDRSFDQLAGFDAAWSPVGADGYPRPLFDRFTGKIDKEVVDYMRNNGFDLRYYLEQNWAKIGPSLAGKIHVYVGDMDNYYLNLAVYKLEDFLKGAQNPPAVATFEYGRPMKGHCWQPFTDAEMIRMMVGGRK